MYISQVFVTALAAISTAQACHFATEAQLAAWNTTTDTPHAFHHTDKERRSAPNTKRAVRNLFSWISDMFNKKPAAATSTCPAVWNEISTALTAQFLADGECTDAARAAIRAAFHDCFNGACDGSLILANECANPENRGLERLCGNLGNLANEKEVGVADLIQFAAAHAMKTCPGGPTVPVKIGRTDSDEASPLGVLPRGNAAASDLINLFASKGFSPVDLAALVGAHTTAKQRVADPSRAGEAMDSTVGIWDNKFYSETRNGNAPFTLPADKSISQNLLTTVPFNTFSVSKGAWDSAFVSAMTKMSMLGVSADGLVDCTSALPGGSRKREIRNSNLFDRLKW